MSKGRVWEPLGDGDYDCPAVYNISEYKPGRRVEFELDEDGATLTLIHESPQEATDATT